MGLFKEDEVIETRRAVIPHASEYLVRASTPCLNYIAREIARTMQNGNFQLSWLIPETICKQPGNAKVLAHIMKTLTDLGYSVEHDVPAPSVKSFWNSAGTTSYDDSQEQLVITWTADADRRIVREDV